VEIMEETVGETVLDVVEIVAEGVVNMAVVIMEEKVVDVAVVIMEEKVVAVAVEEEDNFLNSNLHILVN